MESFPSVVSLRGWSSVAVAPTEKAPDRSPWWAAGFGALAGAALFVVAHRSLGDDSYITLDYARNLAEYGHWGLLPEWTTNSQTSPLNAWLLAVGILATGRPIVAVGVLLVATFAVAGWWAAGMSRELVVSRVLPYVLVGLLATSPLLVSTVGLETLLGAAVLVGVARYAAAGRPVVAGVLCGLAVLTRPDLAVPAGVLALALLLPRWRSAGITSGVAAVTVLPWHMLSWFALGGFVPDTVWIKTSGKADPGAPTMASAVSGFYATTYPVELALTAAPVAAALVCAVWALRHHRAPWARVVLGFVAAGWAHWAALWLLGVFPQAWYFSPLVICSVVAVAVTTARVAPRAGIVTALVFASACVPAAGPVPWTVAPMSTNWALPDQYAAIGAELAQLTGGQAVGGPGEIGTLAFHAQVPVLDHFSHRAYTRQYLDHRYRIAGPATRAVLRWNWTHRQDPPVPALRYQLTYDSSTPRPSGQVLREWAIGNPGHGTDRIVLTDTGP